MKACSVRLVVDGAQVAVIEPGTHRSDLVDVGLPEDAGFIHRAPNLYNAGASVEVHFPNGEHVPVLPGIDPSLNSYHGYLERRHQSDIGGWAVDAAGNPAAVTVAVNGRSIATVQPSFSREDLPALGFCAGAGFAYNFSEPLGPNDLLTVTFPDGSPIPGSEALTYQERVRRLLTGIDLELMKGIELGPLDRPLLSKRRADVLFIDHTDTAGLRAKYADTPRWSIDIDAIVPIDVVWCGGALADALPAGFKVDYCIASHVIEHVADPIGWLAGLSAVLNPGGIISLAIPEHSRTFDHRRALSQPADLIGAYIERRIQPTARQIFDCVAYYTPVQIKGTELPIVDRSRIVHAYDIACSSSETKTYVDVHCNVFTLQSFLDCWDIIGNLGLLPLDIAATFEPQEDTDEFIVILRRR